MSVVTHSNKNGAMLKRSIDRFWSKVIIPTDKRECYDQRWKHIPLTPNEATE